MLVSALNSKEGRHDQGAELNQTLYSNLYFCLNLIRNFLDVFEPELQLNWKKKEEEEQYPIHTKTVQALRKAHIKVYFCARDKQMRFVGIQRSRGCTWHSHPCWQHVGVLLHLGLLQLSPPSRGSGAFLTVDN